MEKNKTILLGVFIFLLFFIAGAAGFSFLGPKEEQVEFHTVPKHSTKMTTQQETDSEKNWQSRPDENRENWTVYRSEKFGFEFSVPSEWICEENNKERAKKILTCRTADFKDKTIINEDGVTPDFKSGIYFSVNVANLPERTLLRDYDNFKNWAQERVSNGVGVEHEVKYEESLINEVRVYDATVKLLSDGSEMRNFYAIQNEKIFIIGLRYGKKDKNKNNVINEVVDSLKFI